MRSYNTYNSSLLEPYHPPIHVQPSVVCGPLPCHQSHAPHHQQEYLVPPTSVCVCVWGGGGDINMHNEQQYRQTILTDLVERVIPAEWPTNMTLTLFSSTLTWFTTPASPITYSTTAVCDSHNYTHTHTTLIDHTLFRAEQSVLHSKTPFNT